MKAIKNTLFLLVLISLTACEDVIKLDLKNSEPRLVIESYINVSEQSATVLVSKSNGFYDTKPISKIRNAMIELSNKKGAVYHFLEIKPGKYKTNRKVITKPKETWTIKVTVESKVYVATSKVPVPTTLDTVIRKKDEYNNSYYNLFVQWKNNKKTKSFYRLLFSKKGYENSRNHSNYYSYNLVSNKGVTSKVVRVKISDAFDTNSIIKVSLLSVSETYYEYFRQLSGIQEAQTPYNPKGNFSNNALGYFGVFSASERKIKL